MTILIVIRGILLRKTVGISPARTVGITPFLRCGRLVIRISLTTLGGLISMPTLPTNNTFSRELQLERDKNYMIIKKNRIVQDTHYSMSLADQKILACLIRSIKPNQKAMTLKFSTMKYMKMLGMKWSGRTFSSIMYHLKHIADKSFYMRNVDGTYDLVRWIEKVHVDPNAKDKGNFIVKFPEELRPYLFSQSKKYRTIYKFSDIMLMQSRYSPRLFEIFRSNQSRQKIQKRGLNYSIYELKYRLNLMKRDKRAPHHVLHDKNGNIKFKYPSYYEFKRNVLQPAFKEINRLTEYNVRMKKVKNGRKVVGINVVMTHKNEKQKTKRDDLIYCITHHVPKSEWKNWRENKIKGNFRKVHPRHTKDKQDDNIVDGHFRTIKPSKHNQEQEIKHAFGNHPPFFKEINMNGLKIEYYSPLAHKYIWTTRKERSRQNSLYKKVQQVYKNY